MSVSAQLAKHSREVFFGGNWTCSNLKDNLADVTWQQATTQVHDINTIATLVYHMSYYVSGVLKVLQGDPLSARDTESFSHPPITSQADWEDLLARVWADAGAFAALIEQLPEHKLWENFTDEKYGIYYRNIHGIIEHTHYHLGQIAVVKKILQQTTE
ncbi:MAG: DinB family protein [Taibaiella sp.]|nr:DinB family protein [Taibaiella sp.]